MVTEPNYAYNVLYEAEIFFLKVPKKIRAVGFTSLKSFTSQYF